MSTITLPKPADDIAAATVTRWLKRPGHLFATGEALVELETEEALIVVEASQDGTLGQVLVEAGQTIPVGGELARYEATDSRATAKPREQTTERIVSDDTATADGGTVVPILMPQAGNTMEEGTVVSWQVKEGDQIAVGKIICEIETDKATIDFESPEAGRLARIVAQVGDPVPVKELIALLADNDADADIYLAAHKTSGAAAGGNAPAAAPNVAAVASNGAGRERNMAAAVVSATGRVKASPAARKLADERGTRLATVGAGSGPDGRILSTDIGSTGETSTGERRTPMSKMRRAIGLNLQASKQTIPHFYVRLSIDADPLLAFYREQKSQAGCTLNDLIVLAVGRTISEFPAVRSQIAGDDIIEFPHANIGIAVGMDEGLVVPVVLAVDTLSLSELATKTKQTVENARNGRLDNIGKGNFTISNLGMFGVEEFSAIINPPESGILAVAAIRETAVVENGTLRPGRVMTMTLSADHRIVDGVVAAKFMARLKEILEHAAQELA